MGQIKEGTSVSVLLPAVSLWATGGRRNWCRLVAFNHLELSLSDSCGLSISGL